MEVFLFSLGKSSNFTRFFLLSEIDDNFTRGFGKNAGSPGVSEKMLDPPRNHGFQHVSMLKWINDLDENWASLQIFGAPHSPRLATLRATLARPLGLLDVPWGTPKNQRCFSGGHLPMKKVILNQKTVKPREHPPRQTSRNHVPSPKKSTKKTSTCGNSGELHETISNKAPLLHMPRCTRPQPPHLAAPPLLAVPAAEAAPDRAGRATLGSAPGSGRTAARRAASWCTAEGGSG